MDSRSTIEDTQKLKGYTSHSPLKGYTSHSPLRLVCPDKKTPLFRTDGVQFTVAAHSAKSQNASKPDNILPVPLFSCLRITYKTNSYTYKYTCTEVYLHTLPSSISIA